MNKSNAETLSSYLAACEGRDPGTIAAHFSGDAKVIDPLGEYAGREAIMVYFHSIYSELAALAFDTGPVSWCGPSCAVSWSGKAERKDGSAAAYSGIDVFTFGASGRISQLWAFWTPEDLLTSDNVKQS